MLMLISVLMRIKTICDNKKWDKRERPREFSEKNSHKLATPLIYLYISLCFKMALIYIETSRVMVCVYLFCMRATISATSSSFY